MLSQRIQSTLVFFDLLDLPLTAWEVWKFLLSDKDYMLAHQDENYDLVRVPALPDKVGLDSVVKQLDLMKTAGEIEQQKGFYTVVGRIALVDQRLAGYRSGIVREKKIQRFLSGASKLPFVRGIGLTGSQALGMLKPHSDIDLLIITAPERMWLARLCVTVYFHMLGVRRYKMKIANRFCLNHYLASTTERPSERNLYTAMEYFKTRSLVHHPSVREFQTMNLRWIKMFFPNAEFPISRDYKPSYLQTLVERFLNNRLVLWVEGRLRSWQKRRIQQDDFIFVREDELSFHPDSKQQWLLSSYFSDR